MGCGLWFVYASTSNISTVSTDTKDLSIKMPLVVITGIPSCGKSTRAAQLRKHFEDEHGKTVHVVSENEIISDSNLDKNSLYSDPSKEKEVRGIIKSQAHRLIGKDDVVILDGTNYIKGYRYELYCMSKSSKTTQCTVHCEAAEDVAWTWNCNRPSSNRNGDQSYSKESFDALIMRYETPDSRNRWDSPLFVLQANDELPAQRISEALFDRKPPPPNQSTQNAPLSDTNYLHELDRITQEIVSGVLSAQKMGLEGDVKVPGQPSLVVSLGGRKITAPQLARLRRQFLTYSKMHPSSDTSKVGGLFVQYLNTSLGN